MYLHVLKNAQLDHIQVTFLSSFTLRPDTYNHTLQMFYVLARLITLPLIVRHFLQVFNLETAESEYIKTEHWSEYAVTTVEKILTENDIVSFAAEFKINNHYFGNVEVLTYRNKTIQLRNVILSLNYGRLTKNLQEFSQGMSLYFTFGLFSCDIFFLIIAFQTLKMDAPTILSASNLKFVSLHFLLKRTKFRTVSKFKSATNWQQCQRSTLILKIHTHKK